MFSATLSAELADRVGSRVQVATDTNFFEGVLGSVSGGLIVIIQTSGYGVGVSVNIAIDAINFIRIIQQAA